jgi:peptide methionine sulfoxide reductase MsrA
VRVEFDSGEVTYTQLLDVWWSCVEDPTDGGGQGADRGHQYRLGV